MTATGVPAGPSVLGLDLDSSSTHDDGWVVRDFRAAEGLDGPPGILQGGLSAGVTMAAARLVDGTGAPLRGFDVRLQAPTPLGRDLQVRARPAAAGRYEVETRDGAQLLVSGMVELGEAEPAPERPDVSALARVAVPPPEPKPSFEHCWVCGPHAAHPHALRLVPGWHDPSSVVTRWVPEDALADDGGAVDALVVSAALDCPSVWASWTHVRNRGDAGALLAGYRVRFFQPAPVAVPLRTAGRCDEVEGRKIRASGALLDDDGRLYALSSALHITVRELPTL